MDCAHFPVSFFCCWLASTVLHYCSSLSANLTTLHSFVENVDAINIVTAHSHVEKRHIRHTGAVRVWHVQPADESYWKKKLNANKLCRRWLEIPFIRYTQIHISYRFNGSCQPRLLFIVCCNQTFAFNRIKEFQCIFFLLFVCKVI